MEDPRRRAVAAFSWVSLLASEAYRKAPAPVVELNYGTKDASPNVLAITVLLVLVALGTLLAYALFTAVHREGAPWSAVLNWAILSSLLLPVFGIAGELGVPVWKAQWGTAAGTATLVAVLLVPVGAGLAVTRWPQKVASGLMAVLLITSPFGAIIAGQAALHGWTYASLDLEPNEIRASNVSANDTEDPPGRVVVAVFDEFDRELAFEHRPDGVDLPNLDRLAAESLVAPEAYSTAPHTMVTMHALLTGLQLENATPVDTRSLSFALPDGSALSNDEAPSLFEESDERGAESAVAGWYHPYCRVYDVDRCVWHPFGRQPVERTVASNALLTVARSFASLPPVLTENPLTAPAKQGAVERFSKAPQLRAIESHEFLSDHASEVVDDPAYEVVFLHFNAPHPADGRGFYDPENGTLVASETSDYFDNLALVDETVGDLREQLEAAGLWQDTALVVTGDHGYRQANWGPPGRVDESLKSEEGDPLAGQTVPLLVKPAWPSDGPIHGEPVDNVIVHRLALAFLDGEVESDEELVEVFEDHGREPLERDGAGS